MKNVKVKEGENSEIRQNLCAQYCKSKPRPNTVKFVSIISFCCAILAKSSAGNSPFLALKMQFTRRIERIRFILRNSIHTRGFECALNVLATFSLSMKGRRTKKKSYCFSFRHLFKFISREIWVGPNISNTQSHPPPTHTQLHIEKPKNCAENRWDFFSDLLGGW